MLRNQEQVTDARIFRMDDVPIECETYCRVELASVAGSGDASAVDEVPEVPAPTTAEQRALEDAPDDGGEREPAETGAPGSVRYDIFSRG
jgi:hypothetical protein